MFRFHQAACVLHLLYFSAGSSLGNFETQATQSFPFFHRRSQNSELRVVLDIYIYLTVLFSAGTY
jgi:hypothetical protein